MVVSITTEAMDEKTKQKNKKKNSKNKTEARTTPAKPLQFQSSFERIALQL